MKILRNVSLRDKTTLKLGGPAAFFVSVHSVAELTRACAFAEEHKLPFLTFGGGSNVLFPDGGYPGLVIHINLSGISRDVVRGRVHVTAKAGEAWDALVAYTVKHGLWGLENLSGIPGTVGAAPIQNIGAYGVEVAGSIVSVDVFNTRTKKVERLSRDACHFSYRDSFFKRPEGKHFIVVSVCFSLSSKSQPNVSYRDLEEYFAHSRMEPSLGALREAVLTIRKGKFPDMALYGTAGSFFKNPIVSREKAYELRERFPGIVMFELPNDTVKLSLAWILDHVLNLKGVWYGNVGAFEKQPLVVVQKGNATSREMLVFTRFVQRRVHDTLGITIEPEVHIVAPV